MGDIAKAWWFMKLHGQSPSHISDDELGATPILCADCFDHALSLTMHNASEESSGKRKRVDDGSDHVAEADSCTKAKSR
jgi:hypothetical protein